jgi:hypothetical protein
VVATLGPVHTTTTQIPVALPRLVAENEVVALAWAGALAQLL